MTTIEKDAWQNEAREQSGLTCGRLHKHKDANDNIDEADHNSP